MKHTLDRIEIDDQVVADAYYMSFPEFVNYYRDINGFALRSQGGTHNLDAVYHEIMSDLVNGTRKLNTKLRANKHGDWFQENGLLPTTRPYADIIVVPTAQEEEAHQRKIVDMIDSPNKRPASGRALRAAQRDIKDVIQENNNRLNPDNAPRPSRGQRRRKNK